jgi:hypothetical protein
MNKKILQLSKSGGRKKVVTTSGLWAISSYINVYPEQQSAWANQTELVSWYGYNHEFGVRNYYTDYTAVSTIPLLGISIVEFSFSIQANYFSGGAVFAAWCDCIIWGCVRIVSTGDWSAYMEVQYYNGATWIVLGSYVVQTNQWRTTQVSFKGNKRKFTVKITTNDGTVYNNTYSINTAVAATNTISLVCLTRLNTGEGNWDGGSRGRLALPPTVTMMIP